VQNADHSRASSTKQRDPALAVSKPHRAVVSDRVYAPPPRSTRPPLGLAELPERLSLTEEEHAVLRAFFDFTNRILPVGLYCVAVAVVGIMNDGCVWVREMG
jgi:hypothetical protein